MIEITKDEKIEAKEYKDRVLMDLILKELYGEKKIRYKTKHTELYDNIDYLLTASTINKKTYGIEIKERNTTYEEEALLKVDKLQRMIAANPNEHLIYCVYYTKTKHAAFYDCDKIDWANLPTKIIRQRTVQMDEFSPIVERECYILPISLASYVHPMDNVIQTYNYLYGIY